MATTRMTNGHGQVPRATKRSGNWPSTLSPSVYQESTPKITLEVPSVATSELIPPRATRAR